MAGESLSGGSVFGKTCKMKWLGNIVKSDARPPADSQLCYYQPDPSQPTIICGVIAKVIDGLPTIVEGGESFCQAASGSGTGMTAAERDDPKYDQGFNLGAVFDLTKDQAPPRSPREEQ